MNFGAPPVKPEKLTGSSFDIQGFKNLLDTLKRSKADQENKAKPLDILEE
jgi:hypothetical protein